MRIRAMLLREAIRRRRRDREFSKDIDRYRRRVLAPLGLNPKEWNEAAKKKNRRVFLGEDKVWKFFRSTQRRYAANFAAAAKVADTHRIPAARLWHADASEETRSSYRLCSLVMERLHDRGSEDGDPGEFARSGGRSGHRR